MIKKTIKVRAPARIDFAGGTTDIEPFASKMGGAVLNAAINRYVSGKLVRTNNSVLLDYSGSFPTGSGLGTSGAMNLVWLALISKIKDKKELAETVYRMEQAMGLTGGKQDQYAAAFGGINLLEFKNKKVKVTHLNLKKKTLDKLEKNLTLVYTGKSHLSQNTNKAMIDNLTKNKKYFVNLRNIAREMKNALFNDNLYKFAELMNQETENRSKLHKSIINKTIKSFIKIGKENGALGAKVCGSGGGGCVLFFSEKPEKLKKVFKNNVIDFKFDFTGLKWLK